MVETLSTTTPDDLVGIEQGNRHAEMQGAIAAGIKLLGEQGLVGVGVRPAEAVGTDQATVSSVDEPERSAESTTATAEQADSGLDK